MLRVPRGVMRSARQVYTGRPKAMMDISICTLLNEDRRLTLRDLMNDDLGDPLSRMSISHIVTNLGMQFYQSSTKKVVSRYDKCLNPFGDYVGK